MLASLITAALVLAATPTSGPEKRLYALLESEWERGLQEDPELATYVGDRRYNALLPDRSAEAYARRSAHAKEVVAALRKIDRARLSPKAQLDYDLFAYQAEEQLALTAFPSEL